MPVCKKCGKNFMLPVDAELCNDCRSICPGCGKYKGGVFSGETKRSVYRNYLCDNCWEKQKVTRGVDPETYVGMWCDLLLSDQFFAPKIVPPDLLPGTKQKNSTVSDALGSLSASVLGIGWKTIHLKSGSIFLNNYPIELIRIEDTKDTFQRDGVYTAKILFYGTLPKGQLSGLNGLIIGGIKAKRKGMLSSEVVDAIPFLMPLHGSKKELINGAFNKIINDRELIGNLVYLFEKVTMFYVKWMGPDIGQDHLKLKFTIREIEGQPLLEIEAKTVRANGLPEIQVRDAKELYQKAFAMLLSNSAKIVNYIQEPFLPPPP